MQSFWNFAQSTLVIVHNFKMNGQLRHELYANEISWDLGLRWVSDGYPIFYSNPGSHKNILNLTHKIWRAFIARMLETTDRL